MEFDEIVLNLDKLYIPVGKGLDVSFLVIILYHYP